MKKKEQLDEWLRERLSGREFPYRDAYWEAAEAMIEAQERRRRRWFVIWLNSLGLLLLGVALPAAIWWTTAAGMDQQAPVMTVASAAQSAAIDSDCVEGLAPTATFAEADLPANTRKSSEKSRSLAHTPTNTPATQPAARQSIAYSPKKTTEPLSTQQAKDPEPTAKQAIAPAPQKVSVPLSAQPQNDPSASALSPDQPIRSNPKLLLTPPATPIEAQSTASVSAVPTADPILPSTASSDALPEKTGPSPLSRSFSAGKPGLEKMDVHTETEVLAGTWALAAPARKIPPYGRHRGRHSIGLLLGTGLTSAWPDAESARQPMRVQPISGLSYRYHMGRGLSLKTGLRYQSRSGLHVSHSYTDTDYAFGIETHTTTIAPQSLHSLEMPLLLSVPIAGRHRLQLGLDLNYLLDVYSEVQEVREDAFGVQSGSDEMAWGYRQGFRRLDVGMQAGYRFGLSRRMQVGLDVRYGLRDLTDDAFFESATPHRNVQARLVWEYDLIRF